MAIGSLIVYEPIEMLSEKRDYWREYCTFYEQYWGGPTSPYGVWFGIEYENFRNAIANHLGVEEKEVEDCFFMKDKGDKYYVCPFTSRTSSYLLHSENIIPVSWFVLFRDLQRESFFTPWGFAGISYDTTIKDALSRIDEAEEILRNAFQKYQESDHKLLFYRLRAIQEELDHIKTWLGGFVPTGFIVLNYGEIASFIHPYTIKNERSVKDVWDILTSIKEEKLQEAESQLEMIIQKWEDIRKSASGEFKNAPLQ